MPTSSLPVLKQACDSSHAGPPALSGPDESSNWRWQLRHRLSTKDEILAAQRRKIGFLFTELGVNGSREMVERHIRPVEQRTPAPDGVREAVAGSAG